MKKKLHALLNATTLRCMADGLLSHAPMPNYVIEIPNNPEHGHFATNLPMTLASSQRRNPKDIAKILMGHLTDEEGLLAEVKTAGPGFINFWIAPRRWHQSLLEILDLGEHYGRSDLGKGENVLVEFVSANPTGPLHLGHGRGAALGDTLCRILAFCGHSVVREFYINDAGRQVRLLGESILSRMRQLDDPRYPFPEQGYHGQYVVDLAKVLIEKLDTKSLPDEEVADICAREGKDIMLREIKGDLDDFKVPFDRWYSESELYRSGLLEETLTGLRGAGHLYEEDGALWVRTSAFGDDKDRVIRKKDGNFTYFASDISYHLEKWRRGFTKSIDIWGADHHGYIPRIKAALQANGVSGAWLSVMLIQLVKLWRGGQEVKMSKRAGSFVTLRELLDEVGVDAARFVFLTKHHDSPLDIDIDLVKRQDSDNPVYYVQYAHARISSIFRKAEEENVARPEPTPELFQHLALSEETALIRLLTEFPALLEEISAALEPHRLTYYLAQVAALFHRYFNLGTKTPQYRVVAQDPLLTQARLCLAEAVRIVIANGLSLLGISAPEKM
jgi:arginyl-tRNA synthetase